MLINLKPHTDLAYKIEAYSTDFAEFFRTGGPVENEFLLMDLSSVIPYTLYEEVSMYVLSHSEMPIEEPTPEFSGTEFTMQIEADEFVMVTIGGTVVGMSALEAKQLAAWILEN